MSDRQIGAPTSFRAESTINSRDSTSIRIVHGWIEGGGMDSANGTHSVRRTKAAQIYRKTVNLRAVQLLLGHPKIESTVRYLGIEVEDAPTLSEQVDSDNWRGLAGASQTRPRGCVPATHTLDPERAFEISTIKGRERRESGLALKTQGCAERHRSDLQPVPLILRLRELGALLLPPRGARAGPANRDDPGRGSSHRPRARGGRAARLRQAGWRIGGNPPVR